MISPYKRIIEDRIKPWKLSSEDREIMVKQIAKLRQNWLDFQGYVLGQGRLGHQRLYKIYEMVDLQWVIEFNEFQPDLDDLDTFLREKLKDFDPKSIEIFVHHKRSTWTTSLICLFNRPFYIPQDDLEYQFGANIYRPKFKPIYKMEKYRAMVTSQRPYAERTLKFLERNDTQFKSIKKIKPNEQLEAKENAAKAESAPVVTQSKMENKESIPLKTETIDLTKDIHVENRPQKADRILMLEQEFGHFKDMLTQFIKSQQEKSSKDKGSQEKKKLRKKGDQPIINDTPAKESSAKEEEMDPK